MITIRSAIGGIISAMNIHDIAALNPGIKGGKIGYALFIMATAQKYGSRAVETSHIDFAKNIIKESLIKICPASQGFMTGNSGILWGLRTLYNMGVIESSEGFDRLADIILQHGLSNFYSHSQSINSDNEIYPWGITFLQFWDGTDTLSRYLYEEKILLCLIECERILNGDGPYSDLYTNNSYALLHSILYLASKAYALGIGRARAQRLVAKITNLGQEIGYHQSDADAAILNALVRKESVCLTNHSESLAYLGTFALVYNMPELFLPTYIGCNISIDLLSQKNPEELIGIGLGLISINGNK